MQRGGQREQQKWKKKKDGTSGKRVHVPTPGQSRLAETALGESNVNRRGSRVERKMQEPVCKGRLQIDHRRRRLSRGERRRDWCCRRNDYVRSGTQCASGVRYVCRRVNVRDLNRGPEKQQQRAAKNKGDPPRVSSVLFGLLIVHHSNYNVPFSEVGRSLGCGQKKNPIRHASMT